MRASRSRASSRAPAWNFVCAAARARSARLEGSGVNAAARSRNTPAAAKPAPPLAHASPTAPTPRQPAHRALRPPVLGARPWRSGSIFGSVASAERSVDLALLCEPGRSVRRRPDQRVAEDNRWTDRQETIQLTTAAVPSGMPRRSAARLTNAGSPTGSAAATSKQRRASYGKSGQPSRGALLDLADSGTFAAARSRPRAAPASSRAATRSARAVSRPSRRRSAQARVIQRGRRTDSRATSRPGAQRLDAKLREARERAAQLARRTPARSLRQQAAGDERECARGASIEPLRVVDDAQERPVLGNVRHRPRTASPTRNGFGGGPAFRPKATLRASRCGCGNLPSSSRNDEHSCWSAANGVSRSLLPRSCWRRDTPPLPRSRTQAVRSFRRRALRVPPARHRPPRPRPRASGQARHARACAQPGAPLGPEPVTDVRSTPFDSSAWGQIG